MKIILNFSVFVALVCTLSCAKNDTEIVKNTIYTGNEITYSLESGSDFQVSGTAIIKERIDKSSDIIITLNKTFNAGLFPVHLHFGDVATDQAKIASLLVPVEANTGTSTSLLQRLADGSLITFDDLKQMHASIKVHLSARGEDMNVVLAAGNIGSAFSKGVSNGRAAIVVCKSE